MLRKILYWVSIRLSILLLIFAAVNTYLHYNPITIDVNSSSSRDGDPSDGSSSGDEIGMDERINAEKEIITNPLPVLTLITTSIGTFFAIFFGWREDKRATQKTKLENEELQLKIKELQQKINPPDIVQNKEEE